MNRSGLKSLMGYQAGGDPSDANTGTPLVPTGADLLLAYQQATRPDIGQRKQEYQGILSTVIKPPAQPSFFDLASELGASILEQQNKEKLPSIGRGVAFGFKNFKEKNDIAKKTYDSQLDQIALKATEMAIGDMREANTNYTKLLSTMIQGIYDPDKGTAVYLAKEDENGNILRKSFGNKEIDKINAALQEGYQKIENPLVSIGGESQKGLDKYYEELGRAAGKSEEQKEQDYNLAVQSNQLIEQMRYLAKDLPEGSFGTVPQTTLPIRNFMTGIPGLEKFVNKDLLGKEESMVNVVIGLAMMNIQKTKGPISDTEMGLFIKSIPSLAQSKQGFYTTMNMMEALNNHVVSFEDARSMKKDELLSQKGMTVTRLTSELKKWETEWRKTNKPFDENTLNFLREQARKTEELGLSSIADDAFNQIKSGVYQKEATTQTKDLSEMSEEELLAEIEKRKN